MPAPIHAFLEFFTYTPNILSNPQATFPSNHHRKIDSSLRRMTSISLASINPNKDYWLNQGTNQHPPVIKSCTKLNMAWLNTSKIGKKFWLLSSFIERCKTFFSLFSKLDSLSFSLIQWKPVITRSLGSIDQTRDIFGLTDITLYSPPPRCPRMACIHGQSSHIMNIFTI